MTTRGNGSARQNIGIGMLLAGMAIVVAAASPPAASAATAAWTAPVTVAGGGSFIVNQRVIASDDGRHLTALWTKFSAKATTSSRDRGTGQLARSSDAGRTWSQPIDTPAVPDATTVSSNGRLLVTVHRTTKDDRVYSVVGQTSSNAGATWSSPIRLRPSQSFINAEPGIGASTDGRRVVVAWGAGSATRSPLDVEVVTSRDAGRTWAKPVKVPGGIFVSATPRVLASGDGSRVTMTWLGECPTETGDPVRCVWTSSSDDGGGTWNAAKQLSGSPSSDSQQGTPSASASSDGTKLVISWKGNQPTPEGNVPAIRASFSSDGGSTWSPTVAVSTTVPVGDPEVASSADGSHVTVMWSARLDSVDALWVASSSDGGATWGTTTELGLRKTQHGSGYVQANADVAVSSDGSRAIVAWNDVTGRNSVARAAMSIDNGATWTTSGMSSGSAAAYGPTVTAMGSGSGFAGTWRRATGQTVSLMSSTLP